MPIFMDRHDIPGATAEQVAQAHQLDLKIQNQYNCKGLTYWFDEESCIAFCLIQAPNKDSVLSMHNDSHGLIPTQIIEVDNGLVNAFLGRITDPKSENSSLMIDKLINESGFRTILNLEVKQPVLPRLTENGVIKNLINVQNFIIHNNFEIYADYEIKDIEDGFMASFKSISKAMKCAIEIQKALLEYNSDTPTEKIFVSIGISTGGPVTEKNEIFGETIQLSKRLCQVAGIGEILVSSNSGNSYKEKNIDHLTEGITIKYLKPDDQKFLGNLFDITEKKWDEIDFNISDLSGMIGISKSQLNRKTNSLTGCSPNEFIKEYKLRKALKLLENYRGNISEIAYETGFSNPAYFSKCFQKRFGILPSKLL